MLLIPLFAVLGSDSLRAALDFTTGVLSLVSLTAAVAWGLIARDRLLLRPRHRLLAQGVHRATAVASIGFLLLHVTVKVSLGHVALLGALVPFGLGVSGTSGLIGFGSLAGILMVVAASTGALRSAFATPGRVAGRWRSLHMVAYPAWASALIHGLFTGRPAAGWVVTMYSLALAAVIGALSLRLLPPPLKRTITDRVLALVTSRSLAPASEAAPRDPSLSPLPGGGFGPPQEPPRRQPEPLFREDQQPPPPRLAAPAPPLYEAGPSHDGLRAGTGPGISAAYRAVSASSAAPTERIPLAEQIPMTEEIPVQEAPAPSRWPTPSPPPPAQAVRPPYDPDRAAYGPGAVPAPDLPGYSPDSAANVPGNGQNHETDVPWHDRSPENDVPWNSANVDNDVPWNGSNRESDVPWNGSNPGTDAPWNTPAPETDAHWNSRNAVPDVPAYSPDAPATPTGPFPHPLDTTEPAPGPLYRPAAGEPWHAPAGDRR
ncbi:ferric reductase-like transmembrane domain-containing protein [Streptomyces albidochromogenes]|uniref:hypothetical protein n=1 Tax=Streptomyces albidochromogenes TaxID=329524 RepID=UPI002FEA3D7A